MYKAIFDFVKSHTTRRCFPDYTVSKLLLKEMDFKSNMFSSYANFCVVQFITKQQKISHWTDCILTAAWQKNVNSFSEFVVETVHCEWKDYMIFLLNVKKMSQHFEYFIYLSNLFVHIVLWGIHSGHGLKCKKIRVLKTFQVKLCH